MNIWIALLASAAAPQQSQMAVSDITDPVSLRRGRGMIMINPQGQMLSVGCADVGKGRLDIMVHMDGLPSPKPLDDSAAEHRFGSDAQPTIMSWSGMGNTLRWDGVSLGSASDKAIFLDKLARNSEVHFRYESYLKSNWTSFFYGEAASKIADVVTACAPKKVIRKLRQIGSAIKM